MLQEKNKILAQSLRNFEAPLLGISAMLRRRLALGAVGSASLFGMVAAFGLAPADAPAPPAELHTVIESLALPIPAPMIDADAQIFMREERIQRGDSVASLLSRLGVMDPAASNFLRLSREVRPVYQQLRPGKSVSARTSANGELLSLVFPLNGKDNAAIVVERQGNTFQAGERSLDLETRTFIKSGVIHSSLFGAADAAGIPDAIAIQLADIFGGDIDFHRDLRRGDRFSLVYEIAYHQGQPIRSGRVLAAEFVNNGKLHRAVFFSDAEGRGGYYSADGKSLRKAFLRSPIEFSRISSGFSSSRLHPVLMKWRAHRGVDYAAPIGTRVRATADGSVDFVGNGSGYGKMIVIRHQGKYSTAYAHLNGYASGIRKGARVSQGEVIGYVGMTGLATGPHLHYEFRVSDHAVNPLAVTLPATPPLAQHQLDKFRSGVAPLLSKLDMMTSANLALFE